MGFRRFAIVACVALAGLARAALAQSVCTPAPSSPEARLLAFYAAPLAFAASPDAIPLARGAVVVSGDIAWLPNPPRAIRASSGACGFAKPEHSGLAPVFPRPRIRVGLGGGLVAEASWLPPVTVADATPHLGAVAVAWTPERTFPGAMQVTLRLHATLGGVDGPITCPMSALQTTSAAQACYGTNASDDTYDPRVAGAEAVASKAAGGWRWYAGGGVNSTHAHLQVNFTNRDGVVDHNQVETSLTRAALLAGAAWSPRAGLALSVQLYAVPADVTTGRIGIAWRVR
ncbi:MAG TPA: hypothetical protein VG916_08920 [Gemmatimonadaceae bacterium]|nr:hypothetical protein [Gemmatimonadaceae bacterium]